MAIMEILGAMASGGGTGILGGVTGMIGAGVNMWAESKKVKAEADREKQRAVDDRLMAEIEYQNADKISMRESTTQMEMSNIGLITDSIKNDKASYSTGSIIALQKLGEKGGFASYVAVIFLAALVSVDVLRGYTRPVLTWYLTITVAIKGESAGPSTTFMASTALGWWFGTRMINAVKKK